MQYQQRCFMFFEVALAILLTVFLRLQRWLIISLILKAVATHL
jgi:hypothetical protein